MPTDLQNLTFLALFSMSLWATTGQVYGLVAFAVGLVAGAVGNLLFRPDRPPARPRGRGGGGARG